MAESVAIPAERRRLILETIRDSGQAVAAELAQRFGCSDDTIRRDLDRLAAEGKAQRVHGGALRRHEAVPPYAARQVTDVEAKAAIAATAAALIRDDAVVVLDGGTTCLQLAARLRPDLRATIVTPSPSAAEVLAGYPGIRVELLGGRLLPETMATVGPTALEALARVRPDVCVLGLCGVHPEAGVTVANADERDVKAAMLRHAVEVVALVGASKLGAVLPFVVGPAERLTRLVVDADAEEGQLAPYRRLGVDAIRAPRERTLA